MKVSELIEKLREYPPECVVVVDTSCDYEDYSEASKVTPGYYGRFRGGFFHTDGPYNSVLIK